MQSMGRLQSDHESTRHSRLFSFICQFLQLTLSLTSPVSFLEDRVDIQISGSDYLRNGETGLSDNDEK